jgi:hypothetical protein
MPKASAKTISRTVKLAPDQSQMIEQRAQRCKVSVGVWMRVILMQVASKPSRDGYHRVREPNGELT